MKIKNYTVKTYKKSDAKQLQELKDLMDTAGISKTLLDDYGNDQEFISVQHKLTEKVHQELTFNKYENIQFQDKFIFISKEEFIYTDASGNEVRFIEGTEQADTIVVEMEMTNFLEMVMVQSLVELVVI